MRRSNANLVHELLSGQRRGVGWGLLRGVLAGAEMPYRALIHLRNRLYDRGVLLSGRLPVPVISVGNLTAGGTGKTPMVRWLALRLQTLGLNPAVLLRGYKRDRNQVSDEQALLSEYLAPIPVHADPDRLRGGRQVLAEHPQVKAFIVDDGFQHRRLFRNFDLVLVDASNPFGFEHVHPRGLLREPLSSLKRADAIVLSRSDLIDPQQRERLEQILRSHNPIAPIYRACHALTGLRSGDRSASQTPDLGLEALRGRRFFAFAGIANPASLQKQLAGLPGECCGHFWFDDHHDYCQADLAEMRRRAAQSGAEVMVVTEKDWAKLRQLSGAGQMPLWRLEVQMQLAAGAEAGLLGLIQARIDASMK